MVTRKIEKLQGVSVNRRLLRKRAPMSQMTMTHAPSSRHDQSDLAHDLRNGLAGVRGAVQIVRDSLASSPERDVLSAALARLDRIDVQLRQLLAEEGDSSDSSGVRRIVLPPFRLR